MRIKSFLFACVFLGFVSATVHAENTSTRKKETSASDHPIQANKEWDAYATGMIYARPTRGRSNTGFWLKSDEMHLVVGNFQDDTKYSGNTWDVSTKDHSVFEKVESLDQSTHYVFNYWYSYPFHWQKQKTNVMVTDVRDAKKSTDFEQSGLPFELNVIGGKRGTYTQNAVTNGRIVEVFRWNTYILDRPICSFVLDQGGSKRGAKHQVANEVTFNIYSEEACQYVEAILPYGLELKVTYDVAYATIDKYDNFAHKITVDKIPGLVPEASTSLISAKLSEQQRLLLENPEFQRQLQELIRMTWEKMYGPSQTH